MPTSQDTIKELKERFLVYYRQLPHKTLAANSIGRSLDTINSWEKSDQAFSAQVLEAKADFAQTNMKRVRSREWVLERVLKEEFSERKEMTGKDGKDLPTPLLTGVIDVRSNNSTEKAE